LTKYKIVYFNSLFSKLTLFSLFYLLFLRKKKVIIAPRGELFEYNLKKSNYFFKSIIIFFVKRYNIYWHLTSELEKNEFEKHLGTNKNIKLIPNLIDFNKDRFYNSINNKIFDFIFVGRVISKKGLLPFLENLNRCKNIYSICLILVIEDCLYWDLCKKEINNTKHNFKIFFNMNNNEVIEYYNMSKFCIMPSFNENHGHVSYEALFANCIPVTTSGCPISKYLIDFDLLIDVNTFFNEKLDNFANFDNKKYTNIIKSLQYSIENDFSNDILKDKYFNLFK
jgi:glycosyltransferase involved in cell wall biosynthesis